MRINSHLGSLFSFGNPCMEMGREMKKIPFVDSPFPYGVCAHLRINYGRICATT